MKTPRSSLILRFCACSLLLLTPLQFAYSRDFENVVNQQGVYNITTQKERNEIVEATLQSLPNDSQKFTILEINNKEYRVSNDHIQRRDGRYLPMTFVEAEEVAKRFDCRIPTIEELKAIARYAANEGNQLKGITRSPNNDLASQLKSMNQMSNDPRMHDRAQMGRERLIDGHFKWYDNKGRIYGLAKGNGKFWQNSPSSAHVRDPDYYDYSHGVRLICPVGQN